MSTSENQIVVYQPNETVRLDVRLENETVWLTQEQENRVNELILQIGDMTDEAQADDLTRQACEAILAEGVIIPCFRPSSWMIYSSTVDAATLPADITAMYPWTQSAASILMMPVPVA